MGGRGLLVTTGCPGCLVIKMTKLVNKERAKISFKRLLIDFEECATKARRCILLYIHVLFIPKKTSVF